MTYRWCLNRAVKMRVLFGIVLFSLLLPEVSTAGQVLDNSNRDWIKDAMIYQIYPQSFNDTNGDGIGDLQGIIDKLDYVQELGATLLWLNPVFDSPFNDAGYDVRDFYAVSPRYGTVDDLTRLMAEAHKRGMRVCLDLVAGHSSVECGWFKESASIETNAYSDYYIWTDHWGRVGKEGRWINGYARRNGNFLINYFWSQPALNYGYANPNPENPWEESTDGEGPQAVIAELKNLMAFWLDMGCDGFRVDMAQSLVKNDPDRNAVCALWREDIMPWLRDAYPYAVMISEWGDPATAVGRAEFDIDFMLHYGSPGYKNLFFKSAAVCGNKMDGNCYFDEAGNGSLETFLRSYRSGREQAKEKGYISLSSANHDFQRLNYYRSENELKVAFAFLLTWSSIPTIYYGDEIGMRFFPDMPSVEGGYTRTGTRTPMQWSAATNAGFSTASADQLYLPIDPDPARPTIEEQLQREDSLLNIIKGILALRAEHPGLRTEAELDVLSDEAQAYPLIYRRGQGDDQWIVALNPSGKTVEQSISISIEKLTLELGSNISLEETADKTKFTLEPLSWGIWRVAP